MCAKHAQLPSSMCLCVYGERTERISSKCTRMSSHVCECVSVRIVRDFFATFAKINEKMRANNKSHAVAALPALLAHKPEQM